MDVQEQLYDTQPSVWGDLTSSRFLPVSFITPTPSHFLSVSLIFSVIINKKYEHECGNPLLFISTSPSIPLHRFLTLVECLVFLINPWSEFHNFGGLNNRYMMCIDLLCIIVLSWHFSPTSRLLWFCCSKIITRVSPCLLTLPEYCQPENRQHPHQVCNTTD
jgi:hypothetical protein